MKKNKGGLLVGALVGASLGVAAGMILAPESGKKIRKDLKRMLGEFYMQLAPKLEKVKKLGETEFNTLIKGAAKNYTKAKKLSSKEEQLLIAEAKKSWKHLKKHLA